MSRTRIVVLAALALVVSLLAPGCIVVHDDSVADLTLYLDFDGLLCWEAGVSSTDIAIYEGPSLVTSATIPCNARTGMGNDVNFTDLPYGNYTYSITGRTYDGVPYTGSGMVTVSSHDENNVYDITLY